MPILGSRAAGALKAFGFAGLVDVIRDAYFKLTTLLLKSNIGTALDSVKTINPPFIFDGSSNNLQIVNTAVQPSKLSPLNGNYYSVLFNGNYYTTPSSAATNIGTSDFTVEFWFNTTTVGANYSTYWNLGDYTNGILFRQNYTGIEVYINNSQVFTPIGTVTVGTWNHAALTRSGTALKLFLNGVVIGSTTNSASISPTAAMMWGTSAHATTEYWYGYMSNFRFVIGTALYTAAFTPAVSLLTAITGTAALTCQNSRFLDNSNNKFAITLTGTPIISQFTYITQPASTTTVMNNGSGYFNGSSYVYAPTNTGTSFGTGDFTIELWVYPTAYSATAAQIYDSRPSGTSSVSVYPLLSITSTGLPQFNAGVLISGGTAPLFAWTHLAASRQGTSSRFFVNGIQVGSTTTDTTSYSIGVNRPIIGTDGNSPLAAGYSLIGYLSNVTVTKGQALYTSNFSPSTTAIPAGANTQLLTLQYPGSFLNNQYVDGSNINPIITANGDVKQGTFSPYSGNFSIYQSVNSTFINATYAANANMVIGTGQFTLEAWIFQPLSAPNQFTIISNRTYNAAGTGTFSFFISGTTVKFDEVQTPSNIVTSTANIALATWQHVAVTRDSSNSIKIFINGVLSSTPVTSAFNFSSTNSYQLGYNTDASNWSFLGYLSNIRVSVGTARYTAAFTPQTTPFINDTATTILIGNTGMLKDMSSNNLAITITGSPTISKFSPFTSTALVTNTNYFSGAFNGTTDYLLATYSALFDLSASDWTLEAWFNARSFAAAMGIFSKDTYGTNYDYGLNVLNATTIEVATAGTGTKLTATVPTMSVNTWYHYAAVRYGTVTTIYLNGVAYATSNMALTNASGTTPTIGCNGYNSPNTFFNGLIYNLRISKSARYTGAFAVPTQPFVGDATTSLLLFNDSRIADSSPNNVAVTIPSTTAQAKVVPISPYTTRGVSVNSGSSASPYIIGGSTFFDGTGDYLTIPTNTIYDLNTGTPKWTFECWAYLTGSNAAYRTFVSKRATGNQWEFGVNPTNSYFYFYNGTVYLTNISTLNNTWTHYAASYDGTTLRMFVNGVFGYSGAVNAAAGTDGIFIGAISGATQTVTGYLSDIRVTKGIAKYTANFYPPVSPLQNESNTILLLNSTNPGAFDSAGKVDMQLLGNAKVSNVQVKYGSSSLYLDGTNSYVVIPARPELDILSGDFTVECWAYPQSSAANQQIIGQWNQTAGQGGYGFGIGAGAFFFSFGPYSEGAAMITSGTYTLNAWYHVAAVRYGSVFTLYVNGASVGTVTSAATRSTLAVNTVLGNYYAAAGTIPASGGNYYQGYIDDLRITKYARYTAAFAPPSTLPENGSLT